MDDVAGKATLPANARRIPIPAAAMARWLADIDDIVELKVTLRTLALLSETRARGPVPPGISLHELLDDPFLEAGMDGTTIRQGLASAIARRTLLAVQSGGEVCVFLNDEAAIRHMTRAGLRSLEPSDLVKSAAPEQVGRSLPLMPQEPQRANIFSLYEELIGSYGHSMAEQLKAAEEEYPAAWIEYAFALASRNNARSWNFVNSVLQRLVREGLPDRVVVSNEHGESWSDPEENRRAEFLDSYRRRHGRLPWEHDNATDPGQNE